MPVREQQKEKNTTDNGVMEKEKKGNARKEQSLILITLHMLKEKWDLGGK